MLQILRVLTTDCPELSDILDFTVLALQHTRRVSSCLNVDHLEKNLGGFPPFADKLLDATFTTVAYRPFVFSKCIEH